MFAPDGSKAFMKPGSSVYSCSNWIALDSTTLDLGPKEQKSVTFSLTAPKNASGGHVSVIFFEGLIENKKGITVSGRIGAIVYVDIEGDIKRSLDIQEISAIGSLEGSPVSIKVVAANKGNTYVSAIPKVTIIQDDRKITEAVMNPVNSLPGDTTSGTVKLASPLKEGKYKAQVEMIIDGKTLTSQSEFTIRK